MILLHHPDFKPNFLVFSGLYQSVIDIAFKAAKSNNILPGEHLYHLSSFFNDLLKLGFVESDNIPAGINPLLVLIDAPPRRHLESLLDCFKPRKIIMLLAEHPEHQPSSLKDCIGISDLLIHPYVIPSHYSVNSSIKSATYFVYKEIPDTTSASIPHDNNFQFDDSLAFDASIMCSHLLKGHPSLYAFRRHLINLSTRLFADKFAHYGRYWHEKRKLLSLPRTASPIGLARSIRNFRDVLLYSSPQCDLSRYLGSPASKAVLLNCKTSFCVENYLTPSGYTTEKALEPLSYGCMPIYVGGQRDNWISPFLEVISPDCLSLASRVISYSKYNTHELFDSVSMIRKSINDYLADSRNTSLCFLYDNIVAQIL
ncbi:hypothetical protein [Synechococcus sp. UW105]|uniref:hypothetical protein n=1 Tax=Synechococcus sp. UW105 TaxID=337067 RepID=UPI001A7E0832|nr:hypothetical protein [Synechococcus sp. UW105]